MSVRLKTTAGVTCAVAILLSGCKSKKPESDLLWSYAPEDYISDNNLGESYFGADGVLLHDRGDFGGSLVRLDPDSGRVLWQRSANWALHPPDGLEPLWVTDDGPNQDHHTLIRLDPTTGKRLATLELEESISPLNHRLAFADGRVLAWSYGALHGIRLENGSTTWRAEVPRDSYLWAPLVAGSRVLFLASTYVAVDARTGSEIFRINGECCAAAQSSSGDELYVQVARGKVGRIDPAGKTIGTIDGKLLDAGDKYVAVQQPSQLAVYEHGSPEPAWTRATTDEDYVTGIALSDSDLFFFSAADDTVWRRRLDAGTSQLVTKLAGRFVVGTERGQTGLAPAHLRVPPQWHPPYLYLYDYSLRAHRLER